ncbi:GNAT family N-acetyltransferase [Enterococcus sp. 2201sp1_2201st1_B8_2201SCRN_220225]|uniref:GNAT family N-acetyltransferase n=1 Tax=unclassified Enterococcus TaxID=2608891 RepID=UPI0034A1C6CD
MITQIRQAQVTDMDHVMSLWLQGNLATHDYIPASYWQSQQTAAKEAMLESQLWLYEVNGELLGFIGLMDNYLAGLFVTKLAQNQGIGGKLLRHSQGLHSELTLTVYQKNSRAIAFYQRHGFGIQESQLDLATQEKEYLMKWHQA